MLLLYKENNFTKSIIVCARLGFYNTLGMIILAKDTTALLYNDNH